MMSAVRLIRLGTAFLFAVAAQQITHPEFVVAQQAKVEKVEWRDLDLTDERLVVTGAPFSERAESGIVFRRFSSETLKAGKAELNFDPRKAQTTTGVVLHLATDSPSVQLRFEVQDGENRGSELGVFQIGKYVEGVRFGRAKQTIELTIESVTPNKRTDFEISLPSWSNPKLTRISVHSRSKLLDPNVPQRVYVALGDSISHGTGQGSATYRTWPFLLSRRLKMSLHSVAVGGGKISPRAAEQVAKLARVDLVTILVGYNDWNSAINPVAFGKQYRQALMTLVRSHPNARIVCITPTFTTRTESARSSHKLDEFRQAVREAVTSLDRGGQVVVFEGTELSSKKNLRPEGTDDVHFSETGARLFATALSKRLERSGVGSE